ncbi:hypothetical protein GCM10025857_14230 [Alicyclobacillus contaminans]|nr:hypothetical protein GCM10025857_14230 [Alicyclobacillus contaminans]
MAAWFGRVDHLGFHLRLCTTAFAGPLTPPISSQAANQDTTSAAVDEHAVGAAKAPISSATITAKPAPPSYPTLRSGSTGPAVLRLQQLLAQAGYLPVTWTPNAASATGATPTALIASPPSGSFKWSYTNTPSWVTSLWSAGHYTTLVQGAVMAYQQVNHLAVDGIAGPQVWNRLLSKASLRNPYGLTYVSVRKSQPQSLSAWWNGRLVVQTPVNTGIAQSPTVSGTYPVYLQYVSQRMSGTDPWGHYYSDPGVPYVSYFYQGEAIHGFVRSAYGYPQSLGCVELPVAKAQALWPYMHLGTLVHLS